MNPYKDGGGDRRVPHRGDPQLPLPGYLRCELAPKSKCLSDGHRWIIRAALESPHERGDSTK